MTSVHFTFSVHNVLKYPKVPQPRNVSSRNLFKHVKSLLVNRIDISPIKIKGAISTLLTPKKLGYNFIDDLTK